VGASQNKRNWKGLVYFNSGIHYAGWTRATAAATSGVGIHHPSGDVMKISNYTTSLVREDDPVRCGVNAVGELHWVVLWNQGVTEGGSSGSPLKVPL
jgi:hypothetical protein